MTCLSRKSLPRLLRCGTAPDRICHPPVRLQPYNDFYSQANPPDRGTLECSACQLARRRGR
jgi:hypothetical protein